MPFGNTVAATANQKYAAEQGVHAAQYNLGLLYAQGHGVPKDLVEAYFWLAVAATVLPKCTDPYADTQTDFDQVRDVMGKQITADQRTSAQARARAWVTAHPVVAQ